MGMATLTVMNVIAPGPIAGAEKSLLASAGAMKTAGHRVILAVLVERRCPGHGLELARRGRRIGVEVICLEVGGRIDLRLPGRLCRSARACRCDVVHAHNYKALTYCCAAQDAMPPLVATFHGSTSHTPAVRLYEWIEWCLFQRIDGVFAVSQAARRAIEKRGPCRCRVDVVPNVLPGDEVISLSRSSGSREGEPRGLLFLGRLSREKGVDVLLDALGGMPRPKRPKLVVAGDGPERSRLEEMSARLGLGDSVFFVGFRDDVQALLNRAEVVVMPSRTEGLPMTLIEAMAAGKPVVAAAVGGIPEVLEDGRTGLLVPPEDPRALAGALEKMFSELEVFSGTCRDNAARVRRDYSPKAWSDRAVASYEAAIESWEGFGAHRGRKAGLRDYIGS